MYHKQVVLKLTRVEKKSSNQDKSAWTTHLLPAFLMHKRRKRRWQQRSKTGVPRGRGTRRPSDESAVSIKMPRSSSEYPSHSYLVQSQRQHRKQTQGWCSLWLSKSISFAFLERFAIVKYLFQSGKKTCRKEIIDLPCLEFSRIQLQPLLPNHFYLQHPHMQFWYKSIWAGTRLLWMETLLLGFLLPRRWIEKEQLAKASV